jgi:hypothetical protein
MGRLVKVLTEKDYAPGVYNIDFNSSVWPLAFITPVAKRRNATCTANVEN